MSASQESRPVTLLPVVDPAQSDTTDDTSPVVSGGCCGGSCHG